MATQKKALLGACIAAAIVAVSLAGSRGIDAEPVEALPVPASETVHHIDTGSAVSPEPQTSHVSRSRWRPIKCLVKRLRARWRRCRANHRM